jgi:thioredoxin reductase (NADPH)
MASFYKMYAGKARSFALFLLFSTCTLFSEETVPVAILGSGPAGLSAALVCGRKGIDTHIFLGDNPGGPLSAKKAGLSNWPGGAKQILLMPTLMEQLDLSNVTMHADTIVKVDFSSSPFLLETKTGKTISARIVVIATGASMRSFEVPGHQFTKNSPKNPEIVAVVGGGDDAANKALKAAQSAKQVHLIVRGSQLAKAEKIANTPNIHVHFRSEVKEVLGKGKKMTGLYLADGKELAATELIFAVGMQPSTELFAGQLSMDDEGYILLEGRTQQTSVQGIFAAGAVSEKQFLQAITSAGDGTKAGLGVFSFLNPN